MNSLQAIALGLVGVFLVLVVLRRRWASTYARLATLSIVAFVMLLPFAWLTCAAIKDRSIWTTYTFLPPVRLIGPKTINGANFAKLFEPRGTLQGPIRFSRFIANSLFLACAGTFLSLVGSSMGGYALAKYRFRGRTTISLFMLASLAIPGVGLLPASYQLFYRFGWLDTYWPLLLPGVASVFGIFLFRQSIAGVPTELIEAGRIDGCSEFRIYLTLVMPLVRPIGAFCLITFLGNWNSFLGPDTYLQSQSMLTLPVVLNQYISEFSQDYGVFLAGTLLAIVPPAVLFFALQREFIGGLTSGAIKG